MKRSSSIGHLEPRNYLFLHMNSGNGNTLSIQCIVKIKKLLSLEDQLKNFRTVKARKIQLDAPHLKGLLRRIVATRTRSFCKLMKVFAITSIMFQKGFHCIFQSFRPSSVLLFIHFHHL